MVLVSGDQLDLTMTFPEPPDSMLHIVALLQVLRRGDPDEMAAHGLNSNTVLPRPWKPGSCPLDLRREIWRWCGEVVQWINHDFAWRPQDSIPKCWPRHPHIAQELPSVAYLRWVADGALSPESLEDWHRYTLPMFIDRMAARLSQSGCVRGNHQQWPSRVRWEEAQRNRVGYDDNVEPQPT